MTLISNIPKDRAVDTEQEISKIILTQNKIEVDYKMTNVDTLC